MQRVRSKVGPWGQSMSGQGKHREEQGDVRGQRQGWCVEYIFTIFPRLKRFAPILENFWDSKKLNQEPEPGAKGAGTWPLPMPCPPTPRRKLAPTPVAPLGIYFAIQVSHPPFIYYYSIFLIYQPITCQFLAIPVHLFETEVFPQEALSRLPGKITREGPRQRGCHSRQCPNRDHFQSHHSATKPVFGGRFDTFRLCFFRYCAFFWQLHGM